MLHKVLCLHASAFNPSVAGQQNRGEGGGLRSDAIVSHTHDRLRIEVLASGSADETLKASSTPETCPKSALGISLRVPQVWDITDGSCAHTFEHHSDKVTLLSEKS